MFVSSFREFYQIAGNRLILNWFSLGTQILVRQVQSRVNGTPLVWLVWQSAAGYGSETGNSVGFGSKGFK